MRVGRINLRRDGGRHRGGNPHYIPPVLTSCLGRGLGIPPC